MTDLRKLLPCPFCHSLAAMHSAPVFGGDHGFRIECEGICHAMTCYWHTEKQAVSAWNRRAALAEREAAVRLPVCIESVSVSSQADGDMVVHVAYNVKPIERGATPVGVITRMSIAKTMERILNRALHRTRGRKG